MFMIKVWYCLLLVINAKIGVSLQLAKHSAASKHGRCKLQNPACTNSVTFTITVILITHSESNYSYSIWGLPNHHITVTYMLCFIVAGCYQALYIVISSVWFLIMFLVYLFLILVLPCLCCLPISWALPFSCSWYCLSFLNKAFVYQHLLLSLLSDSAQLCTCVIIYCYQKGHIFELQKFIIFWLN